MHKRFLTIAAQITDQILNGNGTRNGDNNKAFFTQNYCIHLLLWVYKDMIYYESSWRLDQLNAVYNHQFNVIVIGAIHE